MDVFAALADPVRRALLIQLTGGPQRVVDLAAAHPVSRPAISKHLRLLTGAGLVQVTDHGRERHYALRPAGLADVRAFLGQLASPTASALLSGNALDALDTEIRRTTRDRRAAGHDRHDRHEPDQETA
ncbi:ArsR family transcriptional regulator [Parafrankia colletiae]|uniref:ArsR family transcriptional regulator n=1 Tax=Parafrankia colletiae TaxID=573497 RepID=A0A1S1QTR9_9ACTN|nr:ArsR family transcriptional regulator [Parafrankia colletiae]